MGWRWLLRFVCSVCHSVSESAFHRQAVTDTVVAESDGANCNSPAHILSSDLDPTIPCHSYCYLPSTAILIRCVAYSMTKKVKTSAIQQRIVIYWQGALPEIQPARSYMYSTCNLKYRRQEAARTSPAFSTSLSRRCQDRASQRERHCTA